MLIQLLPSSTVAAGVRVNAGLGGYCPEYLQAQFVQPPPFLVVCSVAPDADGSAPCPFAQAPGKFLGFLSALEVRYRDPCLGIAGTRLQRQESYILNLVDAVGFQIIELDELSGAAVRADDDVVLVLVAF